MRLRETAAPKHIHTWVLTRNFFSYFSDAWRLERTCDCGLSAHAYVPKYVELPPEPLRAYADVPWVDGKLPKY